jgi:hypothetical protein
MGVVNETIEDGVGICRVADKSMPFIGHLLQQSVRGKHDLTKQTPRARGPRAPASDTRSPLASRRAGAFCAISSSSARTTTGHRRRVFDGVMSHVAGAGKVFANAAMIRFV